MDYNLTIWVVLGGLIIIAIISTTINHYKKTKSNQETCIACREMGFTMTHTSCPIPPCKRWNGTGYVNKQKKFFNHLIIINHLNKLFLYHALIMLKSNNLFVYNLYNTNI